MHKVARALAYDRRVYRSVGPHFSAMLRVLSETTAGEHSTDLANVETQVRREAARV